MGRASDPHQQLRRALDRRSFDDALLMARRLPISLGDAARLTTLAAEARSPRFERMALRLIEILIDEEGLTLRQLRWLLERFEEAGEGRARDSERAILRFLRGSSAPDLRDS